MSWRNKCFYSFSGPCTELTVRKVRKFNNMYILFGKIKWTFARAFQPLSLNIQVHLVSFFKSRKIMNIDLKKKRLESCIHDSAHNHFQIQKSCWNQCYVHIALVHGKRQRTEYLCHFTAESPNCAFFCYRTVLNNECTLHIKILQLFRRVQRM